MPPLTLTEGRELDAQTYQRIASRLVTTTPCGVMITDTEARILFVNRAFVAVTGYTSGEVLGRKPSLLQSGRHDPEFFRELWSALRDEGEWQGEIWNRRKSGEPYREWLSISALRGDDGEVRHYVAIFSDISAIERIDERLLHLANHDPLTGLANRTLFMDRLARALLRARRSGKEGALLYLDLDGFKGVNDTLGHPAGDEFLQEVARRLEASIRRSDTVARIGGDEFAVILEELCGEEDVSRVVQHLLRGLRRPLRLGGRELRPSASVGSVLFLASNEEEDGLIERADAAMYSAKRAGGGVHHPFRVAAEEGPP